MISHPQQPQFGQQQMQEITAVPRYTANEKTRKKKCDEKKAEDIKKLKQLITYKQKMFCICLYVYASYSFLSKINNRHTFYNPGKKKQCSTTADTADYFRPC